jgi:hypothetical protein
MHASSAINPPQLANAVVPGCYSTLLQQLLHANSWLHLAAALLQPTSVPAAA